ncbi:MAG TPA: dihydrolipoamide acetyltransferase family protein, partial [Chloroflexota bacterium]|nr:dihydrolipoamide acetyltransferase family protein [Chloroflexota bacterium]
MATPIRMPQLGESVAEGTLGRWLKRVGDWVAKDEPLAEIITDKVNAELPSPVAGRVEALLVQEGETVPAGTEIARVAEESASPAAAAAPREATGTGAQALPAAGAPLPAEPWVSATAPVAPAEAPRRPRSSPLVRRLAEEHGVDLRQLQGTGLGGRITKDDLLAYLERRGQVATAAPAAPPEEPVAAVPAPAAPEEESIPLSPMRRAIAEHLTRVIQTVPQAWTMVEVDMTNLVRWRQREREAFRQREGVDLTYLAPLVAAVVEALKAHPRLTARWAGDRLVRARHLHLGIAVALDDGLIVPVLHDADGLNLVGLARALADLVARARAGALGLADVQGAVFTVNNTGAFGSVVSVPIVPEGQTGIITLEAITRRPVVVGEGIA